MKFAVLVFIASCCLVAVNTKANGELSATSDILNLQKPIECVGDKIRNTKKIIDDFINTVLNCDCSRNVLVDRLLVTLKAISNIIEDLNNIIEKDCKNDDVSKCFYAVVNKIRVLSTAVKVFVMIIKEIQSNPEGICGCTLDAIEKSGKELIGSVNDISDCWKH